MSLPASVERWRSLAAAAAQRASVPLELVLAIIWQESAGNPSIESPVGALGLMQLMPATARDLGVDPLIPSQNIDGGTRHLARLARVFGGDWAAAIAAYNWGEGNLKRKAGWPAGGWTRKLPEETAEYLPHVLERAHWELRGELAVPPGALPPTPPGSPGDGAAAVVAGVGILAGLALTLFRS